MSTINWKKLESLRDLFLHNPKGTDYWQDDELVQLYDSFFAQRIGWKWQSMLTELEQRTAFSDLPPMHIVDWGCGTGVATRTTLSHLRPEKILSTSFIDRSAAVRTYAAKSISIDAKASHTASDILTLPEPTLLLLSHVINELSFKTKQHLLALCKQAAMVMWVEPGAKSQSLELSDLRSELLASHNIVGPCTHHAACPLLKQDKDQDWCHHFAKVPNFIFRDGNWAKFATLVGVDLHTLPFSYLALVRNDLSVAVKPAGSRLLSKTRYYKGHAKALCCNAHGLSSRQISERKEKDLFAAVKSGAVYLDD